MQYIAGFVLLIIGYALVAMTFEKYHKRGDAAAQVLINKDAEGGEEEKLSVKEIRIGVILNKNPKPLKIVRAASEHFTVPQEILLSIWYLESGMSLGGDRGGAGGYDALAQIVKKQTQIEEQRRWHRFYANERDLKIICDHCRYDCAALQGSRTGALGPMQFQPSTWALGAVDAGGGGCPLDLRDAMFTAARKLRNDYERLHSWERTIMEYAGGNDPATRAYLGRAIYLMRFFHQWLQNHRS